MTMVENRAVTGGVDTHLDTHVVAALDGIGGLLTVGQFPATLPGYQALLGWLDGFGTIDRVGVEGTGSYAGRPDPPPVSRRSAGGRGRPRRPASTTPPRQVRCGRRHQRSAPPSPALPAEHPKAETARPGRHGMLLAAKPSARWRAHRHNQIPALPAAPEDLRARFAGHSTAALVGRNRRVTHRGRATSSATPARVALRQLSQRAGWLSRPDRPPRHAPDSPRHQARCKPARPVRRGS
jgi:transposase